MRTILVDWLIDVHRDLGYFLETLYLAISILDRYLQRDKTVDRTNLQLVGVTAMWIASKCEELYPTGVKEFVDLTENAFSISDMLSMEQKILTTLDWSLGRSFAIQFLRRYSKLASLSPEHYVFAKYLLEIAVLQYETCHIRPSLLAAAATCLSVAILNEFNSPEQVWSEKMVEEACFDYKDFKDVIPLLAQNLIKQNTDKYVSVKKKYAEKKFYGISKHPKLNCDLILKLASKAAKI